MRKSPHELQYLEILDQRQALSFSEEKAYRRLLKGYLGELEFDRLCDCFLDKELFFLDDLYLQVGSNLTQIDKMILTGNVLHLIDIKNWRGHYVFEKGSWQANGRILAGNICEQLNRAVRITQQAFNQLAVPIKVEGVLAFVHPEARIEQRSVLSTTILTYNEIPKWLRSLHSQPYDLRFEKVIAHFQKPFYRTTKITTSEKFEQLKKGIRCPQCGSFKNKKLYRQKIQCRSCGHSELKQAAFKEAICQCGLIMHHLPLKKSMIMNFIGEGYNLRYVSYILAEFFELVPHTKFYQNKGVSCDQWFN